MTSITDLPETAPPRGRLRTWLAHHVVALVATAAALGSCLLVPPDEGYREYFEVRTLVCLFAMLAVVKALQGVDVLRILAARLVAVCGSRRSVVVTLVWITLVGSMLLTNDMALIAFLPLAAVVLVSTGNGDRLALVFVLQTAAANLGGMITPFGSPQNLYLYSFYGISVVDFLQVMALPFLVSVVVITALCWLVPDAPLTLEEPRTRIPLGLTVAYLALFALTVAVVLRVVPLWAAVVVPLLLLLLGRRALAEVDYGLMTTFVMFFVLSGNLSRVESLDAVLTPLIGGDVLLWSVAASQVISNVPTAILFSQFTADWPRLLVGVNVGGVGTLVGSLASLITLAEFQRHQPERTRPYLVLFTVVNVGLLVLLTALTWLAFGLDLVPQA